MGDLILAKKVEYFLTNQKQAFKFNRIELCLLLENMVSDKQLTAKSTIQEIIDQLYKDTIWFMVIKFFVYLVFFVIPVLLCIIVAKSDDEMNKNHRFLYLNFCNHCSAIIVQALLLFIEFNQFLNDGYESYWKDSWNYIDLFHALFFVIWQLFHHFSHPLENLVHDVVIKYAENILIVLMFIKCMYFMRMYKRFSIVIKMVSMCIQELLPFLIYFYLVLFVSSLLLINSEATIPDDEYKGAFILFTSFMAQYRNVFGDF